MQHWSVITSSSSVTLKANERPNFNLSLTVLEKNPGKSWRSCWFIFLCTYGNRESAHRLPNYKKELTNFMFVPVNVPVNPCLLL